VGAHASRLQPLRMSPTTLLIGGMLLVSAVMTTYAADKPIDRQAVVTRHNPILAAVNFSAPLTVGNGGFAFTVDATGLQTFSDRYGREGIPTETLSRWCWVQDENPAGYSLNDTNRDFTLANGRVQGFPTDAGSPAGEWLRRNPRDHPLGQVSLEWKKTGESAFSPEDIKDLNQTLDLWRGVITSSYTLGGKRVEVTTACDPRSDTIAVRIRSELVREGVLSAKLAFPRGHDLAVKNTPALDWSHPENHTSVLLPGNVIERRVSTTRYFVKVRSPAQAVRSPSKVSEQTERATVLQKLADHEFRVSADGGSDELEFTVSFASSRNGLTSSATPTELLHASEVHWSEFWSKAAALDLSGSTNPLAAKLENRVVLSQYLTAVQMAGDVPPQESGLTCSTWYGKHHTEMIWWHAAHFALWGDGALLAKNLEWYRAHLPEARALAKSRGLRGARWAKMVGPDDRESPGGNPLIVWNQPHLIYLCELLYRQSPSALTLEKYRDLVLETADGLASMTWFDPVRKQSVLGPPLWIVQEIYDPATSQNPCFELAYWRWTLELAQTWRKRLGLPRNAAWDAVIQNLAPLPQRDGKYVALESHPDTWDNLASRHDHPEMLMALGFLPEAPGVDRATMARTLDAVMKDWDWETKIWGWDYPMIAMTATRLGRPDLAVDVLLRDGPNNRYAPNGHCPQSSDTARGKDAAGDKRSEIAVYLPANGAFLSAVALMVAGWDGCTEPHPGFPKDGSWQVRSEGWLRLP
jgi:hypothetical protein